MRLFLEQSSFPPGCEKELKRVRLEFVFKGEPAAEAKPLIEYKAPDKYEISVNPDTTPIPSGAERSAKPVR